MTEQEIERCLERFTIGKATDVMNFDYAGTLAYIQRLKSENAALRERLEKSVELPVKLEDEVFFFDFNENKVQQGKVIGIRWNYFTPSNPIWVRVQYDIPMIKRDCDIEVWLSMVFTTREAAEVRLAEMKGGKG